MLFIYVLCVGVTTWRCNMVPSNLSWHPFNHFFATASSRKSCSHWRIELPFILVRYVLEIVYCHFSNTQSSPSKHWLYLKITKNILYFFYIFIKNIFILKILFLLKNSTQKPDKGKVYLNFQRIKWKYLEKLGDFQIIASV